MKSKKALWQSPKKIACTKTISHSSCGLYEKSSSHVILLSTLQEEQSPEMTSSLYIYIYIYLYIFMFLLVSRPLSAVFLSVRLKSCLSWKGCAVTALSARHNKKWWTVHYQKIVVSYLVLIPLLASCPGSTIHGRLVRVFCSVGSICFETNKHRNALSI